MLSNLYSIGHIQSDNILKKKIVPEFIQKILKAFDTKTIVMADNSNHLRIHRKALCEKLKSLHEQNIWIVALYWKIKDESERNILEFARERIEKGGENNQNLLMEKFGNYPSITRMFLNDFEVLDFSNPKDSLIDEVIEVKFREDSISIVNKIIKALDLEQKTDKELNDVYNQVIKMKSSINQKEKFIFPLYFGLRMKYIDCKDLAIRYLKNFSDKNDQFIEDYKRVKFIIENSKFLQREHVTIAFYRNSSSEEINYYKELIGHTNQIDNFNDPNLEVFIHVSSIVWTSNIVFMPVDEIESEKIWKEINDEESNENKNNEINKKVYNKFKNKNKNEKESDNDNENEKNKEKIIKKKNNKNPYHITLACYGDAKPVECGIVLDSIMKYYKDYPDIKSKFDIEVNENEKRIVDETFVIDKTNKKIENEIIHPSSYIQLLPLPIKNTTFIKPLKIIEGPNWKQLFFKPFKFKGYYTKFYY